MKSTMKRRWGRKATAGLLAALLGAGLLFGPSPDVQARNWELYDKGEHLFLPEGPIVEDGVILVPLRPIAERFGYKFTTVLPSEVSLNGGVVGSVRFVPGNTTVTFNNKATRKMEKAPRFINGNFFVTLDIAGYLTDIGYSVVPGTDFIQFRPAEKADADVSQKLEEQYWFTVRDSSGQYYINKKGERTLAPTGYNDMRNFGYDGLAPVYNWNQGVGYIDRTGKLAVAATHYRIGSFAEGLAPFKDLITVGEGTYWVRQGFLNRSGNVVIPARFERVYPFSDGLAKVVAGDKTFYIDHTGKTMIPPIIGSTHTKSFSDGLAAVSQTVKINGKLVEKTGYINTSGQFVIPPKYDSAADFSDGLAAVWTGDRVGYIDRTGKQIIAPFQAYYAEAFHDGVAIVTLKDGAKGNKDYTMDKKGQKTAYPGITNIGEYADGLLTFEKKGLWGYMNLSGKVVIEPKYNWASTFYAGAAQVQMTEADHYAEAFIDTKGTIIWSFVR